MSKGKPKDEGSQRKISLPASGLAEDILSQVEAGESAVAPRKETPSRSEKAPDDRIYRFADSLHEGEAADEQEDEAILETWVCFELAGETYSLPVSHVQEILRVGAITRVPHAPHPVRGVTNMRGRVLPVVDLRVRLRLPPLEVEKRSRILVLGTRGRAIGLLVDAVLQVSRIDLSKVQEPPEDVMTEQSYYILGVYQEEDEMVILLDADRVLLVQDEDEVEET